MTVDLNFKHMGSGPPLIVMHGLFGSLDNWMTLGRKWSEDFSVYLIDLRNHGKSPHTSSHTTEEMAEDVIAFMDQQNLDSVAVLGHSMGGKVAMELALRFPDRIDSLIVADMGPQEYPRGHDRIFEGLQGVDFSQIEQRNDISDQLARYIKEPGTIAFLAKNAVRTDHGFRWRMNLDVLEQDYENILKETVSEKSYDKRVLVLKGGKSPYVTEESRSLLHKLFPQVEIESLSGAGHWLHAEEPEIFYEKVKEFLLSAAI